MTMLEVPAVLAAAGCPVHVWPGWATRGTTPGMIQPAGLMVHDDIIPGTVSTSKRVALIRDGYTTLPGPLATVSLVKDGTWHIVATGRCNHAGRGSWRGVTNGNSTFLGVEVAWYPGEFYPDVQVDSLLRGLAALAGHFGIPPEMVCHHKEYAPQRKLDSRLPVDVRMAVGLHLLAQAGYGQTVEPPVVPTTFAATHQLREDAMQRITLTTGLDEHGRGWLPLDGHSGRPHVPWGTLVAAMPQSARPAVDGYWPVPEVGQTQEGSVTLITVEGGTPGGSVTLYLTTAEMVT